MDLNRFRIAPCVYPMNEPSSRGSNVEEDGKPSRTALQDSPVTRALTSEGIHPGKFSREPIRSQESYFLVNNK